MKTYQDNSTQTDVPERDRVIIQLLKSTDREKQRQNVLRTVNKWIEEDRELEKRLNMPMHEYYTLIEEELIQQARLPKTPL
jgi:hypothetical protein